MIQYASTYLQQCSCSLEDQPVVFSTEDHKTFARLMDEGRTAVEAYRLVLSKFYTINSDADIRVCCQNSLFTGRGEVSAFPQDIGSPEDLIRTTDYTPLSEVMTVNSVDNVGEEDPFLDIHAEAIFDEDNDVPQSRDRDVRVRGFRLDRDGQPLKVDVGMGLQVRILDTNTDIFRST